MRLRNPFKSLTWNSLLLRSQRRLRRRPLDFVPHILPAQVLEVRSLLSGNVGLSVVGTAITLTSDSGDNGVDVFRSDATHVEIVGFNGTTINGATSQTLTLSSVFGITVKLGSGYDSYNIFSDSGSPALNIGAGGILFQGKSGGSTGDDLEVFNDGSSNMTIAGSVTVQGSLFHSALAHNGSDESFFELFTSSSGNLTVNGSVFASQSNSGSGNQFNEVFTDGSGNLKVLGSVTEILAGPGSGHQENDVETFGTGSITIGLNVTQKATGGTTEPGSEGVENAVEIGADGAEEGGSIVIGGFLSQTGSNTASIENKVETNSTSGNLTIALGVTQSATSSGGETDNEVDVEGSSSISIGTVAGSVTQTAKSGTELAENRVEVDGSGGITIKGTVLQTAKSSGQTRNMVFTNTESIGALKVTGLISMISNSTGSGDFGSDNRVFSEGGDVSALGVTINDTGAQDMINYVFSDFGAVKIGLGGVTFLGSGSGFRDNEIFAEGEGFVRIAGSVVVTETTTGAGNQYLEIDGDTIIGGALLVTMNGTEATININSFASGLGTVEVKGPFTATMLGSSPLIVVGDDQGGGASPVKFDSNVVVVGSVGGGGIFEYDPANVTFFNPALNPQLINFAKVLS